MLGLYFSCEFPAFLFFCSVSPTSSNLRSRTNPPIGIVRRLPSINPSCLVVQVLPHSGVVTLRTSSGELLPTL